MDAVAAHALRDQATSVLAQPAGVPMPSPCTSVCRMNEASGLCAGCLRTLDEIASWSMADDKVRRAIWGRVAQRAKEFTV